MLKARIALVALATAFVYTAATRAQAPAGAPAGSTALCNDGTYFSGATKSGACSGHKGVKTWYGPAAAPKTTTPPTPTATPVAATKPAPASAPAPTAAAAPKTMPAPSAAAAGGGPGMVWVNTSTKVYHCPTDRYYGKTKSGSYMTEAAAQAAGDKPDAGKKCF